MISRAAFARRWQALPGWRWLGRRIQLRAPGFQPGLAVAE